MSDSKLPDDSLKTPPATAPAPPPLPPRPWIGSGPTTGDGGFTIASYNTLAPTYANGFTYCPDSMMAWPYRWGRILAEIDRLNADIIGFQEMEGPFFAEDVLSALKARGYEGMYLPNAKRGFDIGVALFFRSSAFTLVEKSELRVCDLSKEPEMLALMCGTPVFQPSVGAWTSDQVRNHKRFWAYLQYLHHAGLAFVLQQASSGRSFVACVMHAYWDPTYPEQKACQMAVIAHGMERLRRAHGAAGALLLGDFNFMPVIVRDPRYEDVALLAKLEGERERKRTAGAAADGASAAASTVASSLPGAADAGGSGVAEVDAEVAAVEAAVRAASAPRSSVPSGGYLLLTTGELQQAHPHHPFTRKASHFGQATPQAPLAAAAASAQAAAAAAASVGVGGAAPAAAAAIAAAAQAAAATTIPAPSPPPVAATPTPSASDSGASPRTPSTAATEDAASAALSAAAAAGAPPDVAAAAAAAAAASAAPPMHPDSALPLHIPLRFTSAYASVAGAEPEWTNWHFHGFRECLDYILVATHTRTVTAETPASAAAAAASAATTAGGWSAAAVPSPKSRSPRHKSASTVAAAASAGDDGICALVPPSPKPTAGTGTHDSSSGSASRAGSSYGTGSRSGAGAAAGGGAGSSDSPGERYKPLIVGLPIGGRVVTSDWQPLAGPATPAAAAGGAGAAAQWQLRPVGVLAIPSTAEMLKLEGCAGGGCPNAGTGSDHIPIAARLQWVPVE